MVTGTGSLLAKGLLAIVLLISVAGCNDVPLDGATAHRDTLSEPNPDPRDTIPDPDPDPIPRPSSVRLTYFRRDAASPGGQRRESVTIPITAEVVIDSVVDGGRKIEIARISLNCPMPERVRDSSVALRTGVRIWLRDLELFIPGIRTPAAGAQSFPPVIVDSPSENEDKPSAGISISFNRTERIFLETGKNGSKGSFKIDSVDRAHKMIFAQSGFEFKIREFGDTQEIPLGLVLTIGY